VNGGGPPPSATPPDVPDTPVTVEVPVTEPDEEHADEDTTPVGFDVGRHPLLATRARERDTSVPCNESRNKILVCESKNIEIYYLIY